jgi:hypothetical protein
MSKIKKLKAIRQPGGAYDLNTTRTATGLKRAAKFAEPTDERVAEYARTNGMSWEVF